MKTNPGQVGNKTTELIIDFLIYIPIFDQVIADELRLLAKYMNVIEVEKGEIIFHEGDKGDYVCFVVDGTLDVFKKTEKGKSVAISTLSKGRSIGEMSIIDDSIRSATVRAKSKSTLLTLSKEKFNLILADHSSVGVKVLKGIARLLSMNLRRTSSRLADYMLSLS
jgi:CRP-like cAMP-binding protein